MLITQYRLQIARPNGEPRSDTLWVTSHSWVRQFLDILYIHFANTFGNVTRIDGTPAFVFNTSAQREMQVNGALGQINYGPVVGDDDTPDWLTNYALVSQITHGIGPGQLLYQPAIVNPVYLFVGAAWLNTVRSFVNQSGAIVRIREIALYCHTQLNFFCLIRDAPVAAHLDDMETLTLTWRILTSN